MNKKHAIKLFEDRPTGQTTLSSGFIERKENHYIHWTHAREIYIVQ